jgi:hypothetical protein
MPPLRRTGLAGNVVLELPEQPEPYKELEGSTSIEARSLTRDTLRLTSTETELLPALDRGVALWKVGQRSFIVRHRRARPGEAQATASRWSSIGHRFRGVRWRAVAGGDEGGSAADSESPGRGRDVARVVACRLTGATGLEPAASGVTGRRSNQLSYAPSRETGV